MKKNTNGLRLRNNGVYERVETINGKRRSFSSKDPDEVWRKIAAARIDAETKQEQKANGPLFSDVAAVYEREVRQMKVGTQKSYLPAIQRAVDYFGGQRIKKIEPYQINSFLESVSGMARTTVSNQKTVLNAIFQTWINNPNWRGDTNPSRLVALPHKLRKTKRLPPTEEQVQIVKEHAMEKDMLPAVFFLCTGERRGEALAIQLKDIDFDRKLIFVDKAVQHINNAASVTTTKTEAGVRCIPLLPLLEQALQPYRSMPQDTYVIGLKSEPLTASAYKRCWERLWRKYGMATPIERTKRVYRRGAEQIVKYTDWKVNVCAHQFRHEYVCMLCEAEVPEEIAVQLVGHANARMIHEVYMALKPSMINSAREKLAAFMEQD